MLALHLTASRLQVFILFYVFLPFYSAVMLALRAFDIFAAAGRLFCIHSLLFFHFCLFLPLWVCRDAGAAFDIIAATGRLFCIHFFFFHFCVFLPLWVGRDACAAPDIIAPAGHSFVYF